MTQNNLFINRIVIFTLKGEIAYDERFHKGVNIIRGQNSSGKSTISNFIFYALGADFTDFVPEAKECSEVYAETEMNGAAITLRRTVEVDDDEKVKSKIPIYFFWGDYEEARNPPKEKTWQRFGYNTYADKKSFSNVIFDNLDIPIVKGDSNITIHQLLRLMYVDQDSPTGSLFVYEQFDSQLTRETTAELLLGIYDDELYQNKRRLNEVIKEIDDVKSEIKATKGIVQDPLLLVPQNVQNKIDKAQEESSELEKQIATLKSTSDTINLKMDKFLFNQLSNQIAAQRKIVTKLTDELDRLNYEIEDNVYFIKTLKEKKDALRNSLQAREFLKEFPLEYCPECLTEIKKKEVEEDAITCKLCKENIDQTYGITQGRRMEQEISFQIIESNTVQKELTDTVDRLKPVIRKENATLKQLQKNFDEQVDDVRTSKTEAIENLFTDKGFKEGEIAQFRTLLEQAEYYEALQAKRDAKIREKDTLEAAINSAESRQDFKKASIDAKIKEEALYLLRNDLHRQDEFIKANEFHIDFSNNIAFLSNKHSKYSASSNFYLKITARFAIFLASLSITSMRYPRFILADNMEDKGIEEKRAQNFQKILIDRLKTFDPNNYQVIYTTSYITKELNESDLVVGDYYHEHHRTLRIQPSILEAGD